jgi:hypothetical protein
LLKKFPKNYILFSQEKKAEKKRFKLEPKKNNNINYKTKQKKLDQNTN